MDNIAIDKLKKDIELVGKWREKGKPFNSEQQIFAEKVVDRMLAAKNTGKMGVHLIEKSKLAFIKGYEASDRTSDETSYSEKKPIGDARVSTGISDVAKVEKPKTQVKPTEVPISSPEKKQTRKAPDAANTKVTPPDNQKEGVVSSVADGGQAAKEVEAKEAGDKPTETLIGHNPNEPMPKKLAEDLLANVKWGVEIGAYTSTKDGIDAQLSRKSYAEFCDTPDKLSSVKAYLNEISGEQKDPKEMLGKVEKTKGQMMLDSNADKFKGKAPSDEMLNAGQGAPMDDEGVADEQGDIKTKLNEHREAQGKLSSKDYQDYLHARKEGLNHANAMEWATKNDVPAGEAVKDEEVVESDEVEVTEDGTVEEKQYDEGGPGSGVYDRKAAETRVGEMGIQRAPKVGQVINSIHGNSTVISRDKDGVTIKDKEGKEQKVSYKDIRSVGSSKAEAESNVAPG